MRGVEHTYEVGGVRLTGFLDALGFPGFAHNGCADRRAWQMMLSLLEESFPA
jgi:hypothetical protein